MIYQSIADDPTLIDDIIAISSLPAATVSSKLLALELSGHVRGAPGGRFIKLM